MSAEGPVVVAVVGIDGCGKSSAWRGALEALAPELDVIAIGDAVMAGWPGTPVHPRSDLPYARLTRRATVAAKRSRLPWAYQQLKTIDLIGRSRMRDHVVREEQPALVLTDGDPLVNTMAWSVARLHRDQLGTDEAVLETLDYLSGARRMPRARLSYYLRHAWPLVVVNRLGLAHFALPDVVIHLALDGATAMERIRARGRPLQSHETEAALDALETGYERVCGLVESRRGVRVVRVAAEGTPREAVARLVAETALKAVPPRAEPTMGDPSAPAIEVVATTISGSLKDQRKLGRIGPSFERSTRQPVDVHAVDSHAEARQLTRRLVEGGARTIVSAGGAGTFNAVLEGCHLDRGLPADLRLGFLRKGSADLIGKMLRIPDDVGAAAAAIVDGLEHDRCVRADVITVEAVGPGGQPAVRHLVGFGGLGIFGAVPIFTEARWVKLYKGVLGTLFGDYGPFYVGLSLATAWWYLQRARGRVPELRLELDGETLPQQRWAAVIVVGGDLGRAFPLGRGSTFGDGVFRVVGLPDRGLLRALHQLAAARSGAILETPERYATVVRDVRELSVRSVAAGRAASHPANIDGLALQAGGQIHFRISDHIQLVAGPGDGRSTARPG